MTIELVHQPCPLCGSESQAQVCQAEDTTYGVPGTYSVVRCEDCKHMFINPRPADSSLMDCYPGDYAPYEGAEDESRQESDVNNVSEPDRANRPLLRRVLRAVPGLRSFLNWLGQEYAFVIPPPQRTGESKLLEIGCAHGGFLSLAVEQGWQVDGIEPNEAAAQSARARGFAVQCGFLSDCPIDAGQRECVAMWMVLEHVPNPREVLQEVERILEPRGTLVLSVPNAGTWERYLWGKYWLGYDAPRHLQVFSASRLRQLLRQSGFSEVQIVHQANTRYWWGSLAAWGISKFPNAKWPKRWMHYFRTDPPRIWAWCLLLPGKINSMLRCSGRITVVARK